MFRTALVLAFSVSLTGCEQPEEVAQEGCAVAPVTGQTFALPQAEGDRTFQAHAAFDGKAVWLTHAGVPLNQEDIFVSALRIGCDGSVTTPSVRVPEEAGLQTEPRITSYGGNVLLAWQRDSQQAGTNLSISYLFFDRLQGLADITLQPLQTQYKGAPAGNTWMPELDASENGFVVAGLRGVSDYQSFQSFAQRLDTEGVMLEEAINGELQDELAQESASASLGVDGSVHLVWTRTAANDEEHVVSVVAEAGASPSDAPSLVSDEQGGMAHSNGQYVAWSSAVGEVRIKPMHDSGASTLTLREAGGNTPIYPRVAVAPGGGAVAWLEILSGHNTEIHVRGFSENESSVQRAGSEKTIATDAPAIGAYRISIVHVQDSTYFVTWTEGPTTALQVKWQLIDLSAQG